MEYSTQFKEAILNVLQRQFLYTNIAKFGVEMARVFDKYLGDIADRFNNEILNVDTCNSSALDNLWGKLFKISRNQVINGSTVVLNDDQFREILKIRLFNTTWDGSLYDLNRFMKGLFKNRGEINIVDLQNMNSTFYIVNFELEDWEFQLFTTNKDILPRQAGCGLSVIIIDIENVFGFNGSLLQPFNQGTFINI